MLYEEQFDHHLYRLGEDKWENRQIAVIHLTAMGTSIADRLLHVVKSNSVPDRIQDSIRSYCARVLGKLQIVSAVNVLVESITNASDLFREHAALALGDISDERSIPILLKMLRDDPCSDVREGAAWALRRLPDHDVFTALVQALQDEEHFVREAAADALIEMGDSSRHYATEGLKHPNKTVRSECQYVLNALDDEARDMNLWSGLEAESFTTRLLTVMKLWDLCRAEIIPGLRIALNDKDYSIRLTAILALKCIGNPEAQELIRSAVTDENTIIRTLAMNRMGKSE